MEKLGWKRKKSIRAVERGTERVVALRRLLVETVPEEDFTRLIFVDETSTTLTYYRRYGLAPDGQRLHQAVPLHGGPSVTLIAALTPDGLGALLSVNGAVNGAIFTASLDHVPGPPWCRAMWSCATTYPCVRCRA